MNAMKEIFCRLRLVGRGKWELIVDDQVHELTGPEARRLLEEIRDLPIGSVIDFTIGRVRIQGLEPAQVVRMKDYFSKFEGADFS